jgi:hypothetical protein
MLPRRAGAPVRQHPPLQLGEYLAARLSVIGAGERVASVNRLLQALETRQRLPKCGCDRAVASS